MTRRVLVLLVLAGCGNRGTLFRETLRPLPLVATKGAVVMVVPQTRRAVVITPGEAAAVGVPITSGAHFATAVPRSDVVAILTGTAKAPKLDLLDAAAHTVETLGLPGYFDVLEFSPDGRFGVMVYGQGVAATTVARNLNEIALLSVSSRAVTRLQLDTESLAPTRVLFGPTEPGRQLVALTLERGVALFDALHPEVAARRVSIRPQGSALESVVLETIFSRDGKFLFLRASSLDDVIVVELGPEVGQPVSASINFVAGGRGLADIELPPLGFEGAVLAVYRDSSEAFLLDAKGIADRNKRLALTAPLSQLQLLQGPRVLLWDGTGRTVTAWDVGDGRSGTVVLDSAFAAPTVVPSLDKGLFPSGGVLSVVTVLEETNRLRPRIQAIQLAAQLDASAVDSANPRLFFAVQGSSAVVTMDLRTLTLSELTLDADVARLFHLPQGDWMVVDHGSVTGDLTVLPAGSVERGSALRFADFALTGDLDRAGDAP